MADLNLRELSAPIRSLRTEVKAAHKRLDAKWRDIHDTFNKLPIPGSVSYVYDSNPDCPGDQYTCIEWFKWKGKKRICKVQYESDPGETATETSISPVEEWNAEDRLNLLDHVPALFKQAEQVTQNFIKKTNFPPTEDALYEILVQYGYGQTNGDEMSGYIAESNGCGWAPDVVEDIEIESEDGVFSFKATVKYFPDGPYSDDVCLLYNQIAEYIEGALEFEDDTWSIVDCVSTFKTFGIMGDGE